MPDPLRDGGGADHRGGAVRAVAADGAAHRAARPRAPPARWRIKPCSGTCWSRKPARATPTPARARRPRRRPPRRRRRTGDAATTPIPSRGCIVIGTPLTDRRAAAFERRAVAPASAASPTATHYARLRRRRRHRPASATRSRCGSSSAAPSVTSRWRTASWHRACSSATRPDAAGADPTPTSSDARPPLIGVVLRRHPLAHRRRPAAAQPRVHPRRRPARRHAGDRRVLPDHHAPDPPARPRAPGDGREGQPGRPEHPLRHQHRRRVPAALRDVQHDAGRTSSTTPTSSARSTRAWT